MLTSIRTRTPLILRRHYQIGNMSQANSSDSGFTGAQRSKQRPTRSPNAEVKKVVDDILLLYQLKPSEQAYQHYRNDAIFSDPLSIAKGLGSIKSQFNGMPKIFSESTTEASAILENQPSHRPNTISLDLTQRYVFKVPKSEKTIRSIVTLLRDDQGKIQRHDEEWGGEKNKTASDGFMGKLQEMRKKFSAGLIDRTVTSDPNKV